MHTHTNKYSTTHTRAVLELRGLYGWTCRKQVWCGWGKAEKGDGDQIQWRELGEKARARSERQTGQHFVLVAMVQFMIRLALTQGTGVEVGTGAGDHSDWVERERLQNC